MCSRSREENAAPRHVQLTEDLRLDAEVEDFSALSRFQVGPRGEIIVLLPQDMQIRLYDSTGARIASVGRRGSGPGEFQSLTPVTWVGDTLFMWDLRLRRMNYFALTGTILRTRQGPPALSPTRLTHGGADRTFMLFTAYASYPDGSVLGEASLVDRTDTPIPVAGERVMLTLSDDGSTRVIGRPPSHWDERWMITVGRLRNYVPFTLLPQTAIAANGSRFAFMTTDQSRRDSAFYTVSVFRPNGDTIFVRTYAAPGVPVARTAIDSAAGALGERVRGGGEVPASFGARFESLAKQRAPAVHAPVERFTLGLDGTIWIDLRPTAEGQVTLVLDERGDSLGSVLVPPRSRVQQASRTHVWVTEVDEFGLASIVRYRVHGLR